MLGRVALLGVVAWWATAASAASIELNAGRVRHPDGAPTPSADIARAAAWYLERRPSLPREDCSGLVEAILARAGSSDTGSAAMFWERAAAERRTHQRHRPDPGDLAFFDYTYDRNDNGLVDEELTHIGVVVEVEADGTIVVVHLSTSQGIAALRMNLDAPDVRSRDGTVLNDWLGKVGYGPPEHGRLAGQLWRGFASVGSDAAQLAEADDVSVDTRQRSRSRTRPVDSEGARRRRPSPVGSAADVPSSPPSPAPGPVREVPPLLDAIALEHVLDGRRVMARELRGATCLALWQLENAVYARHGYPFTTPEAQATFASESWYRPDPSVTVDTIGGRMTPADDYNLEVFEGTAVLHGCR
jgi:hypothetical protein